MLESNPFTGSSSNFRCESSVVEQCADAVVAEVAEPGSVAPQGLEAAVDGLGRPAGSTVVEVGQNVVSAAGAASVRPRVASSSSPAGNPDRSRSITVVSSAPPRWRFWSALATMIC